MNLRNTVSILACLFSFVLFGCDSCACKSSQKKSVVREYEEIEGEVNEQALVQKVFTKNTLVNSEKENPKQGENSYKHQIKQTAPKEFVWKLPRGWVEGKEKPMRVFTAIIESTRECVVTIFPGDVGGLRSNITRWLMQLGVELSSSDLDGLIKKSVVYKGKIYPFLFVDLRLYTVDKKESAFVAIFRFEDATLFVKLTDTHVSLHTNQERFLEFAKSITAK